MLGIVCFGSASDWLDSACHKALAIFVQFHYSACQSLVSLRIQLCSSLSARSSLGSHILQDAAFLSAPACSRCQVVQSLCWVATIAIQPGQQPMATNAAAQLSRFSSVGQVKAVQPFSGSNRLLSCFEVVVFAVISPMCPIRDAAHSEVQALACQQSAVTATSIPAAPQRCAECAAAITSL